MTIPILPYDKHIAEALKILDGLGADGIDQLRLAMSVLVYRLSKILTAEPAPSSPIADLLAADIAAHVANKPETAEFAPSLPKAKEILDQVLTLSGYYVVDRVLMRVKPDLTDPIAEKQHPSMTDTNKPYSAWGRVLPFRALFCLFGVFSIAFPVMGNAKRYDDVPNEDSIVYDGGSDKPKVRQDKQRTFSTMLDAVDYKVGLWKSHTKSEVAYIGKTPFMGSPAQRPGRKGKCYWRKPKGSISPDIMIVKLRNQAPTPDNVTHCVDMKFGDDKLGEKQQDNYLEVFPDKLYILYFPNDCMAGEPEEKDMPDWVKVLMALLLIILLRGRIPKLPPTPVPVPG